ncbi:hypothetical protein EYF80_020361 [Liparis tanakae]|uniref:Uncharacterized protein n=1 Tax=Liparis tanakae TaxID=230148 RepID=A0A4Z2HUQ9_9TELE|nr:hypothetical protein EYF80_020361 [Liparis tanakae]
MSFKALDSNPSDSSKLLSLYCLRCLLGMGGPNSRVRMEVMKKDKISLDCHVSTSVRLTVRSSGASDGCGKGDEVLVVTPFVPSAAHDNAVSRDARDPNSTGLRWLEPDRESNQRGKKGATWLQRSFRPKGFLTDQSGYVSLKAPLFREMSDCVAFSVLQDPDGGKEPHGAAWLPAALTPTQRKR